MTVPAISYLSEENLAIACQWLARQDPALHRVIDQHGLPPLWKREANFASLVHIILEQQVSLESAKAAFNRLQSYCGKVTPELFLNIPDDDLLQIGFSRQKKLYVRSLAEALLSGSLSLEALNGLPEDAVRAHLQQIKGIGSWTSDIYLLFCLLRPDVLPKGDIALYQAIKELKQLENRPLHPDFIEMTKHWRPLRSAGCRLLWHFYLCERGRGS